MIDMRFG